MKESALVAITAIATTIGQTSAPYLVPLLPALLDKAGDSKVRHGCWLSLCVVDTTLRRM